MVSGLENDADIFEDGPHGPDPVLLGALSEQSGAVQFTPSLMEAFRGRPVRCTLNDLPLCISSLSYDARYDYR